MKHHNIIALLACLLVPQLVTAASMEGIPIPPGDDDLNVNIRGKEGESIPQAKDEKIMETKSVASDEDGDIEIADDLERMLEELKDVERKGLDIRSAGPPAPPSFEEVEKKMKEKAKKRKGKKNKQKAENYVKNQMTVSTDDTERGLGKRQDVVPLIPKSYGIDMDSSELAGSHPNKKMRKGYATDTHSCDNVRPITDDMRSAEEMFLPIDSFYYHYTEAYGILIIGSANVTASCLSRACYVVKTLFGSRYDLRNSYYKMYGRMALIGDGEQQTSLPEYKNEPADLNIRVRGLGPTITKPVTSAGSDNQCCLPFDRYWDQDIAVHELAHAVHLMCAQYLIPGFADYLQYIYEKNVVDQGKWANLYAATNAGEYFATAVQMYFNSYFSSAYVNSVNVYNRETLRLYDPDIAALLDLVFPCAMYDDHILIDRCSWKKCYTGTNFALLYPQTVKARSQCTKVKTSYSCCPTADHCANFTCKYLGNAFNWKNSECQALKCVEPAKENMELIQGSGGAYNIYYPIALPTMTLEELQQIQDRQCTEGPHGTARCTVPKADRIPFGEPGTTKRKCKKMAGCWGSDVNGVSHCYFADQQLADRSLLCPAQAIAGHCDRNPNFMYYYCPMSCDIVEEMHLLPIESELKERCGDHNIYCDVWADGGECDNNPGFMNTVCKLSCLGCTVTNPLP